MTWLETNDCGLAAFSLKSSCVLAIAFDRHVSPAGYYFGQGASGLQVLEKEASSWEGTLPPVRSEDVPSRKRGSRN